MRKVTVAAMAIAGLAAGPAAALEPVVGPGETIEARVDGDLDEDGAADLAYIVSAEHWRELRVVLSRNVRPVEALDLGLDPLGPASLTIDGKVLLFGDLTGGTTAISSTRRYRYDGSRKRMRLIGLDATFYSRTFAHDGFEASWNLVNGNAMTRELKLDEGDGDPEYRPRRERRFKQLTRPRWLPDSPDPELMIEEMRQD